MNSQKNPVSWIQLGMNAQRLGLSIKVCRSLSLAKKQMFAYGFALASGV